MNYRMLIAAVFAVGLSACTTPGYHDGYGYNQGYNNRGYDNYGPERCLDCGRVVSIERYYYGNGDGSTSGAGAVTGAIVGGALGNQVGSGSGRTAATVAGAVAGGVVGNNIERNRTDGDRYDIHIQLENGRRVVVTQRDLNGLREGSYVRIDGGRAYAI